MANVVCSCTKCSAELGTFRNSWTGIGKSYFSPVHPPVTYINGFEPTENIFTKGPDGSAVQNTVLQDLACRKCDKIIGLICNDAPKDHLLKKNQLILRLAEMHVVSEANGEKATISVLEKIPLMPPGTKRPAAAAVRRAATLQPTPRQETAKFLGRNGDASVSRASMQPSAQIMPPPTKISLENPTANISAWVEDAIKNQQKDIDRISGTIMRMERDMASFKDFMIEVRAELEANRVTRKTQHESTQDQLTWLQEDLKEIRQENGHFFQDLREEELPDIRNQLDQLREEIDSQEQTTTLSNVGLPRTVTQLNSDLLAVKRKANEVDDLKKELQKLQQRLVDVEEKRRDSSPKSLTGSSQPSQVELQMTNMPQNSQMIMPASRDNEAQIRRASPTRHPPGSFPDSVDLITPENTTNQATNKAVGIRPLLVSVWSYTGAHQWRSLKVAFEAFGLEYPKLGAQQSIGVLEDHVNNLGLQKTASALRYGKVTMVGEKSIISQGPSEPGATNLAKRKRDEVEASDSIASDWKKAKHSEKAVEVGQESSENDPDLQFPSTDTPGVRALTISSTGGSPELGRDSVFRSLHGQPANGTEDSGTHHGASNLLIEAHRVHANLPDEDGSARANRQSLMSRAEFDRVTGFTNQQHPMPQNQPFTPGLLKSIEHDRVSIPGAFPSDTIKSMVVTSSNAQSERIAIDLRTDKTKLFQCGCCDKKFRNPSALQYHKRNSSCTGHPRDITPTKFRCPYCSANLTYGGLAGHLLNSTCQESEIEGSDRKRMALANGQQSKPLVATNEGTSQHQS